jgi:hypothetical protein
MIPADQGIVNARHVLCQVIKKKLGGSKSIFQRRRLERFHGHKVLFCDCDIGMKSGKGEKVGEEAAFTDLVVFPKANSWREARRGCI